MSQVEFGEMCGFYQTYLSRIETGQANPTLNAVEVIANALGMNVFDLFDYIKAMLNKDLSTDRHSIRMRPSIGPWKSPHPT